LIFRRSNLAATKILKIDEEAGASNAGVQRQVSKGLECIEKQTAIFHWEDVCYDIKIKSETRQILDRVDGWVKPGTLTALMVSATIFPRPPTPRKQYANKSYRASLVPEKQPYWTFWRAE